MKRAVILAAMCAAVLSARGKVLTPQAQLKRSCARCHGLDVVRAQRLPREDWERELDKMTAMGAKVADRQALVEYLARKYGKK